MSVTTLTPTHPDELNELFGQTGFIRFEEGPGGLPVACLKNGHAETMVSIYGGHVLSYLPDGEEPVLWVSEKAQYETGKAIRGGIPIIWPWFGASKRYPKNPSHGFARKLTWDVHSARLIDNTVPQLHLDLQDNDITHSLWPHSFRLELVITLSDKLDIELRAINLCKNPFDYTAALHSYFNVSDIKHVSVLGLERRSYLDQLDNMERKIQEGPITFTSETDNIFYDTRDTCRLIDTGFGREIVIEKHGSTSTVVWNPWIDKSKRMSDFGDEEYHNMVCIETANAGPDVITLNPGGHYELCTSISTKPL